MSSGLRAGGLHKRFGDTVALDGVDLAVEPGGMLGFLGPNGAGKSTTMRAIMRMVTVDAGDVTWDGRPIDDATRRRFGYMPQERGLYDRMKLHEQIVYFGRLAGVEEAVADRRASELLDRVGLGDRRDDEVQELSTGNKQRVQLAVALVHEPICLILDEPFAGLDPIAVDTLREVIGEQTAAGVAVVFSSHQLDVVQDLCRDVIIVDRGRTVADGAVDEIRARSERRQLRIEWASPDDSTDAWTPAAALVRGAVADGPAAGIASDGAHTTAPSDDTPRRIVTATLRADADPAALMASAASAGSIASFRFEPPSLDDVFAELVAP